MKVATCSCGARWHDNQGASHCAACGLTFTSVYAFDAHRRDVGNGRRGCHDPRTHTRNNGTLMFAARHDALGATVWEHAARANTSRAWYARDDTTETPPGT